MAEICAQSQDALRMRLTYMSCPFSHIHLPHLFITLTTLHNKNLYHPIKESPIYRVNKINWFSNIYLSLHLHVKHSNLIYKAKKGWDQCFLSLFLPHSLFMLHKSITIDLDKPGILLLSRLSWLLLTIQMRQHKKQVRKPSRRNL